MGFQSRAHCSLDSTGLKVPIHLVLLFVVVEKRVTEDCPSTCAIMAL